jgi:hypothetical protein
MYNRFLTMFTQPVLSQHAAWVPPVEVADEAPTPVAMSPIEHTLHNVNRAKARMLVERDELDKEIRILAERSRQLTVSAAALLEAAEILYAAVGEAAVLEEIALAQGA